MVDRIDKLTPEQEAQMEPWADMWIKKGLCCEEADWATFDKYARRCYKHASLKEPEVIVPVGDPLTLSLAAPIASYILHGTTRSAMSGAKIVKLVRDVISNTTDQEIVDRSASAVYDAVRGVVEVTDEDSGDRFSKDKVSQCKRFVRANYHRRIGGCWWLNWQAFESFFRIVCGLKLSTDERAEDYSQAQQSVGWWYPTETFIMVCDRPFEIHREQIAERGFGSHRLHNIKGPALSYRNGYALYFVEGVQVAKNVVMDPESITVADINSEKNAEVRRIMMNQYGIAKFLTDTGAETLDMDMEGVAKGAAPRALVKDKNGDVYLIGSDGGTGRVYAMRVDNSVRTCKEAHQSICGFDESRTVAKS